MPTHLFLHDLHDGRASTGHPRVPSHAPSTYRGFALLTIAGALDERAVTDLRTRMDSARDQGASRILVNLEQVIGWTHAGLVELDRLAHAAAPEYLGFAAPPAALVVAAPCLIERATFPSLETATAVLTAPVGPLPHLPAGGIRPIRHAHRPFPTEPASVFAARHWARTLLTEWKLRTHIDPILSALGELAAHTVATTAATNASFQAAAHTWRDYERRLHLTVSVTDTNPHLGAPDDRQATDAYQRGLRQIATLADQLGCYRQHTSPTSKVVWFTINVP
ncbi:hypothetical protein [Longispora urticae]